MSLKSNYLKAFNHLLFQFLDFMISIVEDNKDIKTARNYFDTIKKMNSSLIIRIWFFNVFKPYEEVILSGNLETFLLEKDFEEEAQKFENSNEVLSAIQKLKHPIKEMSEENKKLSVEYIIKLSQLSGLWI